MTEIIVPAGFTKEPREVLACLVCGAEFEMDQVGRFERHVGRCSVKHEQEIEAQLDEASIARVLPSMYGPEAGDAEYERWFKRNARAILEGRVKP